jgi:hypothetical protein
MEMKIQKLEKMAVITEGKKWAKIELKEEYKSYICKGSVVSLLLLVIKRLMEPC